MANVKISQLTAKGSNLSSTDRLAIAEDTGGGTFASKYITGQEIIDAASSGGSQDLQSVTNIGNTTINDLIVTNGGGEGGIVGKTVIVSQNTLIDSFTSINSDGSLILQANGKASKLKNTNVTNIGVELEFPDKATGSYTIATTSDIPSLTGYVSDSRTINTSAPLSGGGDLSANRTLSISQATTSTDGYLSSTDWNTFNNKQAALGFTPENVANKQTDLTASSTKYPTVNAVNTGLSTKQDTLVSGTNIKTVQSTSIVGSGDVTITDANLSTSDVTTNNVSITKHGFVPKAPNNSKKYLDGTGAWTSLPIEIQVACSDETTALTAGVAKVTFRTPCAMTVTAVRASLTTAQSSGAIFTVDINKAGTSILSTKLTIDNTELTSTTAATPAVISDSSLADDAEITIDIDQTGDGTAKGLKVTIIGTRA